MIGAALLRPHAYQTLAADAPATAEALVLVSLVAVAHALGAVLRAVAFGWSPATGLIFGFVGELAFWAVGGASISLVGRAAFRSPATSAQVLRAFAFAAAPGVLILGAALASVATPGGERLVLPAVALWRLAAAYVATRESLRLSAGRNVVALATGVGAGLLGVGVLGTALDAFLPD